MDWLQVPLRREGAAVGGELIKTQALTFVFVSGCSSPPPPSHASGRQGFGVGGWGKEAKRGRGLRAEQEWSTGRAMVQTPGPIKD